MDFPKIGAPKTARTDQPSRVAAEKRSNTPAPATNKSFAEKYQRDTFASATPEAPAAVTREKLSQLSDKLAALGATSLVKSGPQGIQVMFEGPDSSAKHRAAQHFARELGLPLESVTSLINTDPRKKSPELSKWTDIGWTLTAGRKQFDARDTDSMAPVEVRRGSVKNISGKVVEAVKGGVSFSPGGDAIGVRG